MKVIDLLVKIANKEDLPNKIKYSGYIFEYDTNLLRYGTCFNGQIWTLEDYVDIDENLNDEIEIIGDKKIEKLDLQYKDITKGIMFEEQILMYCDNLQYKINEIIDRLNGE